MNRIRIIRDKYNKDLYGFNYGGKLIRSGYMSLSSVKNAIEKFRKSRGRRWKF